MRPSRQRCSGAGGSSDGRCLRLGRSRSRGDLGRQGHPIEAPCGSGTESGHRWASAGGSGGVEGGFVAHLLVFLQSGSNIVILEM